MDENLSQNSPTSLVANGLSDRQRQCMALVATGLTSKQIARSLCISPSTVDNHIRAVVDRLGARNRIDAARMALSLEKEASLTRLESHDSLYFVQTPLKLSPPTLKSFEFSHLPPMGGLRNEKRIVHRFMHVIQISLLGTMAFAAITATIAGIVNLFSL
jgi:DNA-binding CsgD family transcriptional regulator